MTRTRQQKNESLDQFYHRLVESSSREDLVMFINACFAATQQNQFYSDRQKQAVSIEFLHQYVLHNYRRLYARSLAAGINHFSQTTIVFNLLKSGAPEETALRIEEGELIRFALSRLPANRVFGLFKSLRDKKVNNRRTRAVIKSYVASRSELPFDAIKYRNKLRAAVQHVHLSFANDVGEFLFNFKKQRQFKTDLLDKFRQAHFSAAAVYELPFTIAESLIQKHNIPRDVFFRKIEHKMTKAEKLRYQTSVAKTKGARVDLDLKRVPLTKLLLYILSRPTNERMDRAEEFNVAIQSAAKKAIARSPLRLGRVAAVLDQSRSSRGSRQRRNRPLAVAIGVEAILQSASSEYQSFWTAGTTADHSFLRNPEGQTALAAPLIDAFEWDSELIVIVSDGYENDPPDTVRQIAMAFRNRLGKNKLPEIIHVNPVFDADHFSPRTLGPPILTVGLRDAEDLATMLGFARFASGAAPMDELEQFLEFKANQLIKAGSSDG